MAYKFISRVLSIKANYFNVSVFRESWMLREEILNESDIDATMSFFSPNVVHINNERFELFIQPSELRITLKEKGSAEEFGIAIKIIKKLTHIPYNEVELSIKYLVEDFDEVLGKTLFYNTDNKIFKEFEESDDSRFGGYLSKNYLDSRFKLQVHPVIAIMEDEEEEVKPETSRPKENVSKICLQVEGTLTKTVNEENLVDKLDKLISHSGEFYSYTEKIVKQIG